MNSETKVIENKINNAKIQSEKEYIKFQQRAISEFYKEYFTWDVTNIGYWLVTGLFTFMQVIFLAIPYEQMLKEGIDTEFKFIMATITAFPVFFYIQPYIRHNEKNYIGTIYNKIKYLPVSIKAMRMFRFNKMIRFIFKVFIVCAVIQFGFSLLFFHRILIKTVLNTFLYGLFIPFCIGSMTVLGTR